MTTNMLTLYKPIGLSCCDLIRQLQTKDEYKDQKMAFTGRLDEMAHGNVILLIGDETKKVNEYHNMNKVYKFRFVVGLETDSTATLGLFQNKLTPSELDIDLVTQTIMKHKATEFDQEYHVFSSFRPQNVKDRKPLWWFAFHNRLDEIKEMPKKKVKVYDVQVKGIKNVTLDNFINEALGDLSKLRETLFFRKDQVIDQWQKFYDVNKDKNIKFVEFECEIKVSSGFYIRQFVKDIGKELNLNVLVTEIERLSYFE